MGWNLIFLHSLEAAELYGSFWAMMLFYITNTIKLQNNSKTQKLILLSFFLQWWSFWSVLNPFYFYISLQLTLQIFTDQKEKERFSGVLNSVAKIIGGKTVKVCLLYSHHFFLSFLIFLSFLPTPLPVLRSYVFFPRFSVSMTVARK